MQTRNLPLPQSRHRDTASNLSQNPVPLYENRKNAEPPQNCLVKAIAGSISWLWNAHKTDVSLVIRESQEYHRDRRIHDIARVEGKKRPTKMEHLIVWTAQRSFALQFDKYEREKKATMDPRKDSRVKEIHEALHSPHLDNKRNNFFIHDVGPSSRLCERLYMQ